MAKELAGRREDDEEVMVGHLRREAFGDLKRACHLPSHSIKCIRTHGVKERKSRKTASGADYTNYMEEEMEKIMTFQPV